MYDRTIQMRKQNRHKKNGKLQKVKRNRAAIIIIIIIIMLQGTLPSLTTSKFFPLAQTLVNY
jgi:hypothetical protein